MTVRELARMAWIEIAAHKARSALTSLSLAIGVAAMLFTFSQTAGTMKRYKDAIELYGAGRISITAKEDYKPLGLSAGLTIDDADELRRVFPELFMVSPRCNRYWTRMSLASIHSESILVSGVTPDWRLREWVYKLRGRFINGQDVAEAARVCLFIQSGGWVKKPYWARYFPESPLSRFAKTHDMLGRQVMLNDRMFTVVGVLQAPPRDQDPRWFHSSRGEQGTFLIPITAYQAHMTDRGNPRKIDALELDTANAQTIAATLRRVKAFLLQRHQGENDIEVKDFREMIGGSLKELRQWVISVMIIGIVAVLASGIGIMNVTLATIYSRIREIGIRRSLGATRLDVIAQFVTEAMALGIVAGAAGTGLGIAAIHYLAPREDRMAAIGALHVAAALLLALATGFLFALYPAYKASRFDPIEALRYE